MADDRDERIAQLEAENAALRADAERRDRALTEALEQQTATAEILRAIASTPTDLQGVIQEVAHSAMRHSHSTGCVLSLREGETHRTMAFVGDSPRVPLPRVGAVYPVSISRPGGRAMLERRT